MSRWPITESLAHLKYALFWDGHRITEWTHNPHELVESLRSTLQVVHHRHGSPHSAQPAPKYIRMADLEAWHAAGVALGEKPESSELHAELTSKLSTLRRDVTHSENHVWEIVEIADGGEPTVIHRYVGSHPDVKLPNTEYDCRCLAALAERLANP